MCDVVYNDYLTSHTVQGQYFDDSEPIFPGNKPTSRSWGLHESNVLRSLSADKERANNVAKIKVAVRKRPLNKKEIAKKEEDIITIDSNFLTVCERKLKKLTIRMKWELPLGMGGIGK
ncbi:kinesin KIF2A-like protein [Medicago truncatula]|uniref:Kinesin KIF2A-like protein n=1 Tax=Medicago truncatula TaxID=3880 RepID=G7ZUN5_MEDTR|nr:kinesin KIF2A-like protein [Medicago truncatula]